MTNYQKEIVEFVSKNEGYYGALVLRVIKYPSTRRQGLSMIEKIVGKGLIENRGGRLYMPTVNDKKVKPRTFEWRPLVHSLTAPFQRPTYSGESGVVIRSRMNATESELLFA